MAANVTPPDDTKIKEIDITGLQAPVAGTAPGTPTATFTPNDKFDVVVSKWVDKSSGNISGNFVEGEEYLAYFVLDAKDGEAFDSSVTVTSDKGTVKEIMVDVQGSNCWIWVKLTAVGTETPAPTEYTITATAGENGTITPSGEVAVEEGENQTFTITAKEGYHIKDVKVNGASVGAVSTYTFEKVAANATIVAEFEKNTVAVVNHSVKFDYNDGSTPTTILLVPQGDVVSEPADPTREGFIFKGWFLGETEYDFAKPVVEGFTLTAKWEAVSAEHTHAWGAVTYTWAEDGSSCTAERVCTEDSTHKETATAAITSAVKTPATETVKGTTTYTATFTEDWADNQTKDIQDIPVLEHEHTYSTEWSKDATYHWHAATCGHTNEVKDKDVHVYDNSKDATCDVCNYTRTVSSGSSSGGGFSGSYNYPVIVGDTDGADVAVSDEHATKGEKITITVKPDAGKQVDEVIVTDADGDEIAVTKTGDNEYTFTMPASKVTVDVATEAADYGLRIVMQINNRNILVNGKTMVNDVAPVIVADRTLVPIRVVTELLGGSAHWDNATRTVTLNIDGKVLSMTIGKEIPGFGTSAVIMNDRTYVPVRYVMEKLGADVEWINATRQIIIEK